MSKPNETPGKEFNYDIVNEALENILKDILYEYLVEEFIEFTMYVAKMCFEIIVKHDLIKKETIKDDTNIKTSTNK